MFKIIATPTANQKELFKVQVQSVPANKMPVVTPPLKGLPIPVQPPVKNSPMPEQNLSPLGKMKQKWKLFSESVISRFKLTAVKEKFSALVGSTKEKYHAFMDKVKSTYHSIIDKIKEKFRK